MIIYGWREEVRSLGVLPTAACPDCGAHDSLVAYVRYNVYHVWYLFQWVTGRKYERTCSACGAGAPLSTQDKSVLPPGPAIPFLQRWGWSFLLALIGVALASAKLGNSERAERTAALLADPRANDVYVVDVTTLIAKRDGKANFTLLRLREVTQDTMRFDSAKVLYSRASGVTDDMRAHKQDDAGYYLSEPLELQRAEIDRLHQAGAIYLIERR